MKPTSHFAAACGAVLVVTSASQAFAAGDPIGVWVDDTGRGAIEIKSCGPNLCGYVVAVKNANDTKGCGKQIIGDAKPVGGGRWDQGWIYSPERKKNYDVELKPLTNGTLRVVGYAGTKLFSRTMIWTAALDDLKRCDAQQATTPPAVVAPATPPVVEARPAVTGSKPASETAIDNAPASGSAKPVAVEPNTGKQATTGNTATPTPDVAAQAPPAESKSGGEAQSDDPAPQANDEPNGDVGGEAPGERNAKEGFKIGDLDLDQLLKRTPSGKCKLDLPWVKVQFDCPQD